jgi:plastocyanin
MYRLLFAAGLVAMTIGMTGCGGYSSAPSNPGDTPTLPADAVVIDVLGERGDRSFSPNPATVPVGTTVVWHNVDSEAHRVVLDDRQLDTGNIAPGAYSTPMTLRPASYHCSIHPTMVGALTNGSTGPMAQTGTDTMSGPEGDSAPTPAY